MHSGSSAGPAQAIAGEKIRIGVSRCLLGDNVRYDGSHKLDHYITETLGRYFDYVPLCPEVEYGLPVPREPMHLAGDPASPRLVTIRTGIDHTDGMQAWAEKRLDELEHDELHGFIFKSRSPSSGLKGVKVYRPSGMPVTSGVGIFAAAFVRRNPLIPVIDEGRLHDPDLRETFVGSVFVYRKWREFLKGGGLPKDLVKLHTELKYLILAHSPEHYRKLGPIVAKAGSSAPQELHAAYAALLMEGLRRQATTAKNTNVLLHAVGYFKKQLSRDEKQELLDVIETYRLGYVPLIVPITLINHYVRKYGEPYLKGQYYFNPYPVELMLRNHA